MALVFDCDVRHDDWAREVSTRNGAALSAADHHAGKKLVPDAGSWEPAVQRIIAFQHLGDDWDGAGAKAPSRDLLASAIGLAYLFSERGVGPPQRVVAGVEGSVLFEWQDADGTYREVEIDQPLHAEVMLLEPGQPARHWTLPTE